MHATDSGMTGGFWSGGASTITFYIQWAPAPPPPPPVVTMPAAEACALLGISPDVQASQAHLTRAYHKAVRAVHPDRWPAAEREQATRETARINAAYEVLVATLKQHGVE